MHKIVQSRESPGPIKHSILFGHYSLVTKLQLDIEEWSRKDVLQALVLQHAGIPLDSNPDISQKPKNCRCTWKEKPAYTCPQEKYKTKLGKSVTYLCSHLVSAQATLNSLTSKITIPGKLSVLDLTVEIFLSLQEIAWKIFFLFQINALFIKSSLEGHIQYYSSYNSRNL